MAAGEAGEAGEAVLEQKKQNNNSFFPMPNAQCPMPHAQCPMPNAQFTFMPLDTDFLDTKLS